MNNPVPQPEVKERLGTHLQDIYLLETRCATLLDQYDQQVQPFKDFPDFRAKVNQYQEELRPRIAHLTERLTFYGLRPAPEKNTVTPYMGQWINGFLNIRPATFADYATTLYTLTHFKIAAYRGLMTLAQTWEDTTLVRIAEEHLRAEVAMQQWLFAHLPEVGLYSLQYEGFMVPPAAWASAKQFEVVGTPATFPILSK